MDEKRRNEGPRTDQLAECGCGCRRLSPVAADGETAHHLRKPKRVAEVDRGYLTPCRIWLLAKTAAGYAVEHCLDGSIAYVHRLAYEREVGPIPGGKQLDHLCRVRECVNPAHLEPVTQRENLRRGAGTKLTPSDVRAIRASTESQPALAERFGITQGHISRIRNERVWTDLLP